MSTMSELCAELEGRCFTIPSEPQLYCADAFAMSTVPAEGLVYRPGELTRNMAPIVHKWRQWKARAMDLPRLILDTTKRRELQHGQQAFIVVDLLAGFCVDTRMLDMFGAPTEWSMMTNEADWPLSLGWRHTEPDRVELVAIVAPRRAHDTETWG